MKFERFFRIVSYAAVFCGFLSLWISGTFGPIITISFATVFIAAWLLEDTRYQLGEKLGTVLIVLALPVFYGLWYANIIAPSGGETWIAGLLSRMILCLTCVKLLQKKSDRDWIFLYLMVFFQVLLAAGLSISGMYLVVFVAYLLIMTCSIVAFEIRKTARTVQRKVEGVESDKRTAISSSNIVFRTRRVSLAAAALIVFIVILAVPLFFLLPRVGGAGLGSDQRGLSMSGFSDRVTLGDLGRIIENDSVVMRVKLEGAAAITNNLYFRGVALDTFDNRAWSRSRTESRVLARGGRGSILLAEPTRREMMVEQQIYLEPMNTAVLFALPTAIAIQGNFPILSYDSYGSISHMRTSERITYRVASDLRSPSSTDLIRDNKPYAPDFQNYLTLPLRLDPRITELAGSVVKGHESRYEKALAIQAHLQNNFGYTLDQKASGAQPLADFLFNVREGHCEYFATAMAMMLRTQGIAARVVNGFHGGDYNDASGFIVVRQRHAHAWVEAYFPGLDSWVTFDPTPFSGQPGNSVTGGFTGEIGKYLEAIEAIWIEYFVAYDDQGQRSMGRSLRTEFQDYQSKLSDYLGITTDLAAEWLAEVRGDKGFEASIRAVLWAGGGLIGLIAGIYLSIFIIKKMMSSGFWSRLARKFSSSGSKTTVDFYERLLDILKSQGYHRSPFQTPLEFAYSVGDPDAVKITRNYHRVRFGAARLSREEKTEIEAMLARLKDTKKGE